MLARSTNTLVDQTPPRSTSASPSRRTTPTSVPASGPVSVDLGTRTKPGSFNAGFGVTATRPRPAGHAVDHQLLQQGFATDVNNGGACEGAGDPLRLVPGLRQRYPGARRRPHGRPRTLGDGRRPGGRLRRTSTRSGCPSGLQGLLEGKPFKFDTLAEGLKQYLFYAETSLRTASNGGEMPVIGKDLQAGADFMGDTRESSTSSSRTTATSARSDGAGLPHARSSPSELGIVLNGTHRHHGGLHLQQLPRAPGRTRRGDHSRGAPREQRPRPYVYKVVSTFKDKPGTEHDSAPSEASVRRDERGDPGREPTYNTVTWTKVPGVTATRSSAPPRRRRRPGARRRAGTYVRRSAPWPARADLRTSTRPRGARPTPPCDQALPHAGRGLRRGRASVTDVEGVTLELKLGQGIIGRKQGLRRRGRSASCLRRRAARRPRHPRPLAQDRRGRVRRRQGRLGARRQDRDEPHAGFYIDTSNDDEFEVGAAAGLDRRRRPRPARRSSRSSTST